MRRRLRKVSLLAAVGLAGLALGVAGCGGSYGGGGGGGGGTSQPSSSTTGGGY